MFDFKLLQDFYYEVMLNFLKYLFLQSIGMVTCITFIFKYFLGDNYRSQFFSLALKYAMLFLFSLISVEKFSFNLLIP